MKTYLSILLLLLAVSLPAQVTTFPSNVTVKSLTVSGGSPTIGQVLTAIGTNGSLAYSNASAVVPITFTSSLGTLVLGIWDGKIGFSNATVGAMSFWLEEPDTGNEWAIGGVLVATNITLTAIPGTGTNVGITAAGSLFRTDVAGGGSGSTQMVTAAIGVLTVSNRLEVVGTNLANTGGAEVTIRNNGTNDLLSFWNETARLGTVRSNGYLGIGLAPVYPVSASRQVSTNNYTERFTGDFEFVIVPTETILDNWAAVSASTEVWGSGVFYMNEASGVQGNLTFYNSNQSNRGQAVLAHAATGTGSGGGAAYMVGFRTSIDHNSTGIVDTVRGVWVPQVDNGGGSNIVRHVRGVEVWPLSGAGKSDVLAISATGTNDSNWFAGATVIASVRVAQDVRGGNATTNAVVTIAPVYSQTGTAAGTDLLINRSGNIGSGNQFLIDAQLSSFSKFSVRSDGFVAILGGETNSGVLGVAGLSFLRGGVEVGLAGVVGPSDAEFILAGASGRNATFSAAGGGDLSISVGSGGNLFIRTASGIKPTDFNGPIYAKSAIFTNSIQINERAVAIGDVLVAGATNGTAMYTNSLTIPTLNATTVNANTLNLTNALGSNQVRLAITNLTDVSVPGRAAGDVLFWNPTMFKWTNGQPAAGAFSGNSNQIPFLNVAGTGFLFGSHDKSAPGFGMVNRANGNIGALLVHVDENEDIGLVQIGPPNPASNISGFVPSLSITNRYAGDGQTTQEMVRVNFVDVDSGSSAESFIQTWRSWVSGTPPASTLVSYAAALRKDGQLMVAHGVFYPSNSLAATMPTAAQLGLGGIWTGNSNGSYVAITCINGSTTAMKVLAP